jgi:hypothetical protein
MTMWVLSNGRLNRRIDLGAGDNPKEGFTPLYFDLNMRPYPVESDSCDEVWMVKP